MNRIDLPNRYGDHVYLEQDDSADWWFRGDFTYLREIYDVDNNHRRIKAVDPSGGPFLCIGYIIGDKTVTNIEFVENKGYKVTLKNLHGETN